jgi:ABC-type transport system involved in multi-copper enzyme maturation permease subunit
MLVALLGIGIWFGLYIVAGIVSVFSNQAMILTYLPGRGATVTLNILSPIGQGSLLTGTDNIPQNLIIYFLNPSVNVTYFRIEILSPTDIRQVPWYTESLSIMIARSIAVAAIYILAFNFIAWYAFKRAQIME